MNANTPIDKMIEAFWDLCDEDYWWFEFACDQWWFFAAACPHYSEKFGQDRPAAEYMWGAYSRGALDLSTVIINVYEQAKAQHER